MYVVIKALGGKSISALATCSQGFRILKYFAAGFRSQAVNELSLYTITSWYKLHVRYFLKRDFMVTVYLMIMGTMQVCFCCESLLKCTCFVNTIIIMFVLISGIAAI